MLSELSDLDWWIQQTEVRGNVLSLPWRYTCSCWQTPPLRSAVSSWVPHPRADPRTGTEVREQQRATAERTLTITLKGRFWAAVAAVCSPSFHLSISFSAPVLSPVSPGPGWRYSDWYTVDSRQLIPNSVSAIQSCSCYFFTPSPKGY